MNGVPSTFLCVSAVSFRDALTTGHTKEDTIFALLNVVPCTKGGKVELSRVEVVLCGGKTCSFLIN